MNRRGTKIASGGFLIGSLLALAVLLTAGTARAAGNPPGHAVALAQRIKARIQPGLPADLMVAEVSLPATLVPFATYELRLDAPQVSQAGTVNVLVTLRRGDQEARAWVRVLIESRAPRS
jgi:hypothetical protein